MTTSKKKSSPSARSRKKPSLNYGASLYGEALSASDFLEGMKDPEWIKARLDFKQEIRALSALSLDELRGLRFSRKMAKDLFYKLKAAKKEIEIAKGEAEVAKANEKVSKIDVEIANLKTEAAQEEANIGQLLFEKFEKLEKTGRYKRRTEQNGEDGEKPKRTPAILRNEIVKAFCQKRGWGKADLRKRKWELRPLMEELDNKESSLPRGKQYNRYKNYCYLFDDAKTDNLYLGIANNKVEPEFDDSLEVYDTLIETLSRGLYPR